MNISAVLSMLVQLGACAPTHFKGDGGLNLTVLVCPMARAADEPAAPPVPTAPDGSPSDTDPRHRT